MKEKTMSLCLSFFSSKTERKHESER